VAGADSEEKTGRKAGRKVKKLVTRGKERKRGERQKRAARRRSVKCERERTKNIHLSLSDCLSLSIYIQIDR
jgi:hypothetical protein